MSQGLKTHTPPEGGFCNSDEWFLRGNAGKRNAFKVKDWWNKSRKKKIRCSNGKALLVWWWSWWTELWMKTSYCLCCCQPPVDISLLLRKEKKNISLLFMLVFLVFDETTARALLFLFYFSAFCLRDSLQKYCDAVVIRSLPVTQWRAALRGLVCESQQWN